MIGRSSIFMFQPQFNEFVFGLFNSTLSEMKQIVLVCFWFVCTTVGYSQSIRNVSVEPDLYHYQWYGKRFDYVLGIDNKNLSTENVPLFIREIGISKRDTFLVLHGGFGAEHSYLLDALLPIAGYAKLVFFDQRGSLRSNCPDSLISFTSMLGDIDRIRKSYGMKRVNIIAHSMGTLLAMHYLKSYPGNVGKLILISGMPIRKLPEDTASYNAFTKIVLNRLYAGQNEDFKIILKSNGLKNLKDAKTWRDTYYLRQFFSSTPNLYDRNNWERLNTGSTFLYKANVGRAVLSKSDYPMFYDFRKEIASHKFPVIIIKPEGDFILFDMENIKNAGNVHYYNVPKCGHSPWAEQPFVFKELLIKAIEK